MYEIRTLNDTNRQTKHTQTHTVCHDILTCHVDEGLVAHQADEDDHCVDSGNRLQSET